MARTDNLTNFLTDVASAIKTKKGDDTPILASDFDTEIENLPSGGGDENATIDYSLISKTGTNSKIINYAITKVPSFDATGYTSFKELFRYCTNLESVNITNASSVTNMYGMFNGCNALKSVPQFDTSNVTNMYGVFLNCTALESIPQFDTSNVTTMDTMFGYCDNIDYSYRMDTSKVTNMYGMFNRNRKMTIIPITTMGKVTDATSMFSNNGGILLPDSELDYLLQLLIGATAYTATKKLKSLGFSISTSSSAIFPPSRWQSLPHYQDFIDAGWTLQ